MSCLDSRKSDFNAGLAIGGRKIMMSKARRCLGVGMAKWRYIMSLDGYYDE